LPIASQVNLLPAVAARLLGTYPSSLVGGTAEPCRPHRRAGQGAIAVGPPGRLY